jgi:hypothetical protein
VAERDNNRTLWVAVAGIAATALVGLAGTAIAWLSARDDRATQSELARADRAHELAVAHAQRTYDRRVAVYLDAIDFLEGQRGSLALYAEATSTRNKNRRIAFQYDPPSRLFSRLQAFGSPGVVKALQRAQSEISLLPIDVEVHNSGSVTLVRLGRPYTPPPAARASASRPAGEGGTDYILGTPPWSRKTAPTGPPPVAAVPETGRLARLGQAFTDHYGRFTFYVDRFEKIVHDEVG